MPCVLLTSAGRASLWRVDGTGPRHVLSYHHHLVCRCSMFVLGLLQCQNPCSCSSGFTFSFLLFFCFTDIDALVPCLHSFSWAEIYCIRVQAMNAGSEFGLQVHPFHYWRESRAYPVSAASTACLWLTVLCRAASSSPSRNDPKSLCVMLILAGADARRTRASRSASLLWRSFRCNAHSICCITVLSVCVSLVLR